jgi:hypothetical protein
MYHCPNPGEGMLAKVKLLSFFNECKRDGFSGKRRKAEIFTVQDSSFVPACTVCVTVSKTV